MLYFVVTVAQMTGTIATVAQSLDVAALPTNDLTVSHRGVVDREQDMVLFCAPNVAM